MAIRSMKDVVTRVAEVHQVPQRSLVASIALVLSVFVGSVALTAALGSRWDILHFRIGFTLLRFCVYAGAVSGALGLAGLWITLPFRSNTRGFTLSILACLISGLVIGLPVTTWMQLKEKPPIHDITTDLANPPRFRVISHFRPPSANPLIANDSSREELQKNFYPDLDSIRLTEISYRDCIKRSLNVARRLGWTIRAANWEDGHIEATDRTFWFGFEDDVVIRITRTESTGCTVDLRSVSRQGRGDGGKNAERIKTFTRRLTSSR